MRAFRIVSLFILIFVVFRAQDSRAGAIPSAGGVEWLPARSSASALSQGELAVLHRSGFDALADLSQPPEKGLGCYLRIASILSASHDLAQAREAYMSIIRELAGFSLMRSQELVPGDLLDGAASIATGDEETALVHFLVGWQLAGEPSVERRVRAGAEFAQATGMSDSPMRVRMLWAYASWALESGSSSIGDDGRVHAEPDYEKALDILGAIAATGNDSDKAAAARILDEIRRPVLELRIGNAFRPGSQARIEILRRNCPVAEIGIYPFRPGLIPPASASTDESEMATGIPIPPGVDPVRRIVSEKQPERPYYPVRETIQLDELMLPGTYLARATGSGIGSGDFLFITDSILTLKAGRTRLIAMSSNASTGRPVPGAEVSVLVRRSADAPWQRSQKLSDASGIAEFRSADFPQSPDFSVSQIVAASVGGEHQAIAILVPDAAAGHSSANLQGRIFSDASRYKSGGRIHAVAIVRSFSRGDCAVPGGIILRFALSGPEGFRTMTSEVAVDGTGLATADFQMPQGAPAGQYSIGISDTSGQALECAPAILLVEPAVQPSLAVQVSVGAADVTPGMAADGSVRVLSRYGAPVQGQNVELVVQACSFDTVSQRGTGPWRNITRQTVHTNALGEARFQIQTESSASGDLRYRVTATARDAEGLVVRGTEHFTAANQDVYPVLATDRSLYEENQRVVANLKTLDSAGRALPLDGTLRLLRESWREVWVDRRGHEISGEEMQNLRRRSGGWFSFGQGSGDYVLKTQGFVTETVSEIPFSSGSDGTAVHSWENAGAGYYRYVWITNGRRGAVVSNEAPFWVSGQGTEISGYRSDRIRLVLNDPPFSGSNTLAMITVPANRQNVLLLSGADDIDAWSVVEMKGTARLVTLARPQSPTSYLEATGIGDEQASSALAIVSKPAPEKLCVSISGPAQGCEPSSVADFSVAVVDSAGRPAAGARIVFMLSAAEEAAPSPCADIFPSVPQLFSIRTTTSTSAKPFFQPTLTPPAKDGAGDSAGRAPDGNAAPPASATLGTGIWTVVTDCDSAGRAVLPVQMPDRISLWVAAVVASAPDGGAGAGFAAVETKESLSLSLSTPTRVFVGDFLDLSAVMSNHLSEPREAACSFESAGQEPSSPLFEPCTRLIQPGSSATMGWTVSYRAPGRVSLSASVATAEKTARITREIDVAASPFSRRRGISALLMQGEVSLANTQGLHMDNATLSVTASPSSVALAALSGLLADLSPGSTEAAGRLAAVSSVRRLLSRMHYDPSSIAAAMQASGVSDYERDRQDADLRTILSAQGVNGAWGWLSPAGASPFTTAYNLVMLGLCDGPIAEKLGPALEKGRDYAASELVAGTQPPDMQVLLLYGLASRDLKGARPSRLEARALVSLMRIQDRLSPMALSCLTLCAAQYGFGDEASGLAAALRARAVRSRDSRGEGVAHWPGSDLFGSVPAGEGECTAMAVLALVSVDGSRGELVQDGLRYIFSRAENFAWDGPRETTLCTLALRDYSAHSLETDIAATCLVGAAGNTPERYDAASEKQPALPIVRPLPDPGGDAGRISADIVRSSGQSPLFVSLSADQIHPSDSGAESGLDGTRISRSFLRVVQVPTLLRGFDEKIVELEPGSILRVGERIETVIVVDTKRTIPEAVIIQPMPGFVTWHPSASDTSVVNLDNSSQMPGFVASFSTTDEFKLGIENLPPGRWEIRIPMRVDFEGDFAVPPALIRIPQKASLSASGGLMKVRCEGATTQNAPQ